MSSNPYYIIKTGIITTSRTSMTSNEVHHCILRGAFEASTRCIEKASARSIDEMHREDIRREHRRDARRQHRNIQRASTRCKETASKHPKSIDEMHRKDSSKHRGCIDKRHREHRSHRVSRLSFGIPSDETASCHLIERGCEMHPILTSETSKCHWAFGSRLRHQERGEQPSALRDDVTSTRNIIDRIMILGHHDQTDSTQ